MVILPIRGDTGHLGLLLSRKINCSASTVLDGECFGAGTKESVCILIMIWYYKLKLPEQTVVFSCLNLDVNSPHFVGLFRELAEILHG